jgi:hypothetical protein
VLFLQRKYKNNMAKIRVNDTEITILEIDERDYISLTDMVKGIENGLALIEKWLRNKNTIEFLGIWEEMYNPNFNSPEFEGIKNAAGLNRFILSVKQWIEKYKVRLKELNRIAIQQMMVLEEVENKKLLK